MKQAIQKRKCPICKKEQEIVGTIEMGFFIIDKSPCYMYPYCSKKCFEEAKNRGLWK